MVGKKRVRAKRAREELKKVKASLKENEFRFNAPNMVTILRLILVFVIIFMIFSGFPRIVVAAVFAFAALTDALDGYISRRFRQVTFMGAKIDSIIDRIFIAFILIALGAWVFITGAAGTLDRNSLVMIFLIGSRELVSIPGLFIKIVRGKNLIEHSIMGKITNWFQGFALTFLIAGFGFAIYFAILTAFVGLVTGFDFLRRSLS